MISANDVTFIVPIYKLGIDRLNNLKFILPHIIKTGARVLVVEQVKESATSLDLKEFNSEHLLYVSKSEEFHKTGIINWAVKNHANTKYVWVNDVDFYMKFNNVLGVEWTEDFIKPYSTGKKLTSDDSTRILRGEKLNVSYEDESAEYISLYGALSFIFEKNAFLNIGGMDESLFGWGKEDIEFDRRLKSKNIFVQEMDHKGIHLWHTVEIIVKINTPDSSRIHVNNYFDKIFCLNLKRRPDRLEKVAQQFKQHGIVVEIFDAVDALKLSGGDLDFIKINKSRKELLSITKESVLACLLSHYKIIKKSKSKGYKKILIFEDDVIIGDDFEEKIQQMLKIEWKMLYLGSSQFDWNDIQTSNGFYHSKKTLGTFAYAVDSSIYDDIIQVLDTKRSPIDNLLTSIQEKYYQSCYTIYPNIVIADVTDSDIREQRSVANYANQVKWDLSKFSNYKYQTDSVDNSEINNKVTLLVKSFMRKGCVTNLIESIRRYYPTIKIVVVDDTNPPMNFDDYQNVKTYNLEFDSGVSVGRNYGVSKIDTDYFVLLDDDFEFTKDTKIENFYSSILKAGIDVLGGQVIENGKAIQYFGNFVFDEKTKSVITEKGYVDCGDYKKCQLILNFFIARTDRIRKYGWNNELKTTEHSAFFYEHRNSLGVGFIDNVSILHKRINVSDYKPYRLRGGDMFLEWQKKNGIDYFVNYKNVMTTSPDLPKYKFDKWSALKNLIDLDIIFRSRGIPYWIQDGTLLGCVREKDFIGHDLDTDVGVMFKDFSPGTIESMKGVGFELKYTFGYPQDSFEISLSRYGIKTDIFFYYQHRDFIYHCAFYKNKRIDYRYKKFNTKEISFLGHKFFVPVDEMEFILTKYGKDWNFPNPKWDWAYSPLNHYDTGYTVDVEEQKRRVVKWMENKEPKQTNVITYGTFDTLHYGHIEIFRRAKEFGTRLIVGLSTDEFNEIKGKKSKFSYNQRKEWLESIKYIDTVIPETNWNQKVTDIDKYGIDLMVMGDDWVGKFDYLPCRVVYLARTPDVSSTKIKGFQPKRI